MRAGLLIRIRITAAPRGATAGRMPNGHSLAPLADVPDRQRRDGGPELVIRRKHPVVAMPVLPRRRDEIGEPVEELKRQEVDDAVRPRPRGLSRAARADPVGGLVSGEHVADFDCAAACVTCHRESLGHRRCQFYERQSERHEGRSHLPVSRRGRKRRWSGGIGLAGSGDVIRTNFGSVGCVRGVGRPANVHSLLTIRNAARGREPSPAEQPATRGWRRSCGTVAELIVPPPFRAAAGRKLSGEAAAGAGRARCGLCIEFCPRRITLPGQPANLSYPSRSILSSRSVARTVDFNGIDVCAEPAA